MISICVPVYNGGIFLEKCINSILNQTFTEFELLISDDCSTDNSLELLTNFKDDRITIISNPRNMGWVKNCNFLISKTQYPYYCIIPCDDYISDRYIETLYREIIKDEKIINCYPHIISVFHNKSYKGKITQNSITDDNTVLRIKEFILNHLPGVSFRGLVRKTENMDLLYLNEKLKDDMLADTFQILQHAIAGKLVEVDVPYYKYYHDRNTHTKWKTTNDIFHKFYISVWMLSRKYVNNTDVVDTINSKLSSKHKIFDFKERMEKTTFDVIVMGGGIQGCCAALSMRKQGLRVCIIDKNKCLMNGASANHEGKVHLGFVYSNDETFGTAEKMLIDALNFSNSIEYLIDQKIDWSEIRSNKFLYLVPKTSLVEEKDLDIFFEKIQERYETLIKNNDNLNYLGRRPDKLYKKVSIPPQFDNNRFDCCYQTEEYAVKHHFLNNLLYETIIRHDIVSFWKITSKMLKGITVILRCIPTKTLFIRIRW